MDTDSDVTDLVELIFGKKPTIPQEMVAHSSIPSSLLNDDFMKKLVSVLDFEQYPFIDRLKDYFDKEFRSMLLSHVGYVAHVISTCLCEKERDENIFDSFIRVCVLILYFSEETLSKVGVDFSDLNPDIFMVLYRKELNRPFRKRKDFDRLVEYIRNHKYPKWSNDFTAPASQERQLEEIQKKLESDEAFKKDALQPIMVLVREVFSNTSVQLPDLPSEYELIDRLVKYRKREMEKKAEKKRKAETTLITRRSNTDKHTSLHSDFKAGEHEESIACQENIAQAVQRLNHSKHNNKWHENSSHNSDSKTGRFVNRLKDKKWHENIIESVIKHNRSKNAGKEIANNQIHQEANGILELLESKIKSLIVVLDNCSQE